MLTVIGTFYFMLFPTNYSYPRKQTFSDAWEACAASLQYPGIRLWQVDMVTDGRLVGGPVAPKLHEAHLVCVNPQEAK